MTNKEKVLGILRSFAMDMQANGQKVDFDYFANKILEQVESIGVYAVPASCEGCVLEATKPRADSFGSLPIASCKNCFFTLCARRDEGNLCAGYRSKTERLVIMNEPKKEYSLMTECIHCSIISCPNRRIGNGCLSGVKEVSSGNN